jgi:dihydroorotate dehydrogenase
VARVTASRCTLRCRRLIYRLFLKLFLWRIDAERAHALASRTLRLVTALPPVRALLRRLLAAPSAGLRVRALGLDFPSPLGVAAGFDKQAQLVDGLTALGFGFVEVGTITALAQPGNARPRVFRLPADRALVNRMGFPNAGADAAAARLERRRRGESVVGVNVGKSKVVPADTAVDDYRASVRRLAPLADYLVLNVSSPNTPGLRDLQAIEPLRALVDGIRADVPGELPLLVKIAPDLADGDIDTIADLALELGLDGIVAVNTTIAREHLASDPAALEAAGAGGLSGLPLRVRSLEVLRRLHTRTGGRLTLVAVGGIETADDVWERILAGASLVQAYTGFVYGGPLWARRINRGLRQLLRESGRASIEELIGAGTAMGDPGLEPGTSSLSETRSNRLS